MRHTRQGSHLHQLTRFGLVNAYLVEETDGLTLVDTGVAGSAPAFLKAAQTLGQPIRRIVLTHAHVDHTGSLDALHAALPDVPVLLSARDARLLRGERQLDPGSLRFPCVAASNPAPFRWSRCGTVMRSGACGWSPRPATPPARSPSSTRATAP